MKWRKPSWPFTIAARFVTSAYRTLPPAQFTLLQSRLPFTLATNQVEISPVHQPLLLDGTLDQLQQLRIRPMAWSCLGGGRLFNDDSFQPLRDELARVAQEPNAEALSRWCMPGSCACRRSRCRLLAQGKWARAFRGGGRKAEDVPPAVVPYPQSGVRLRRSVNPSPPQWPTLE